MQQTSSVARAKKILSILRKILPKNSYYRIQKSIYKKYNIHPSEKDYEILTQDKRIELELKTMITSFTAHSPEKFCSKFWLKTSQYHIQQLFKNGFENFRQTLALEYFTFIVDENSPQINFLKKYISEEVINDIKERNKQIKKHDLFTKDQSNAYNFLTALLWEYIKQNVPDELLRKFEEPKIGNPPVLKIDERLISQDLANSILEYQSIFEGTKGFRKVKTILEIGAGYGRVSFAILNLHPDIRYIIVDIPPTLYVSQRYLTEVFPNMKIFKFRDFTSWSQIKNQVLESNIIFLMPHQLEMLPDNIANLAIAIDCLNEMNPEIIMFYFKAVNRFAENFYFKSHKVADTPYEAQCREESYPVLPSWQKIFWRNCKVQDFFFEAFYSTKPRR